MSGKDFLIIIVFAAGAAVVSVVIMKAFGFHGSAVTGGGVGGGVGGAIAGSMARKKK